MKRMLKIFVTLCFLILGLNLSLLILKKYHTYSKFGNFFKDKDYEYDVLFLGTSHVLNGILPMDLWQNYGITSYNMAWHTTPIPTSYWQLRLATKKHKPKFVFIDILQIDQNIKYNTYAHQLFDYFPLDETKNQALKDFFPSFKERIEYYFPFIYCHNTWIDIKANNFYRLEPTKGADLRIDIKNPQEFPFNIAPLNYESEGFIYSKKIIEFCKQNGIIPVFYMIPYPCQQLLDEWKKALQEILKKENVFYMEFPENIVDFDIDMYDQNSHLNPSGAKKVTDYIGQYLYNEFDLKGHKNESSYNKWDKDLIKYTDFYDSKIISEKKLTNVLMLLNNDNYYSEISINENHHCTETENKLLEQIKFKTVYITVLNHNFNIKIYRRADDSLLFDRYF